VGHNTACVASGRWEGTVGKPDTAAGGVSRTKHPAGDRAGRTAECVVLQPRCGRKAAATRPTWQIQTSPTVCAEQISVRPSANGRLLAAFDGPEYTSRNTPDEYDDASSKLHGSLLEGLRRGVAMRPGSVESDRRRAMPASALPARPSTYLKGK